MLLYQLELKQRPSFQDSRSGTAEVWRVTFQQNPELTRYLEDYRAIAGEGRVVLNPKIWAIGTVGGGGLAGPLHLPIMPCHLPTFRKQRSQGQSKQCLVVKAYGKAHHLDIWWAGQKKPPMGSSAPSRPTKEILLEPFFVNKHRYRSFNILLFVEFHRGNLRKMQPFWLATSTCWKCDCPQNPPTYNDWVMNLGLLKFAYLKHALSNIQGTILQV